MAAAAETDLHRSPFWNGFCPTRWNGFCPVSWRRIWSGAWSTGPAWSARILRTPTKEPSIRTGDFSIHTVQRVFSSFTLQRVFSSFTLFKGTVSRDGYLLKAYEIKWLLPVGALMVLNLLNSFLWEVVVNFYLLLRIYAITLSRNPLQRPWLWQWKHFICIQWEADNGGIDQWQGRYLWGMLS
jgi:hypothetical protein